METRLKTKADMVQIETSITLWCEHCLSCLFFECIRLDTKDHIMPEFFMCISLFVLIWPLFDCTKEFITTNHGAKCQISRLDLWLSAVFHPFTSCPFLGAVWWSSWPARWYCWRTLHQTRSSSPRYSPAFPALCHQEKGMRRSNWNESINIHTVSETLVRLFFFWGGSDANL